MQLSFSKAFAIIHKQSFSRGIYTPPNQEPITRSLHMCRTLESILSSEELFLE